MKNIDLNIIFCCPECRNELIQSENSLHCTNCNLDYQFDGKIANFKPLKSKSNQFNMDYLSHYTEDALIFDYFIKRECKATEHDERRVREYIKSLIKKTDNLIVDIGSGAAWVAKYFLENNQVISFDVAENNINKAIALYNTSNHFGVVGDALKPPFKKGIFDFIISSEVIEHIVEPKAFIQKLIPLLKPDGKLIISTPYKEVLHYSQCIHCNKMTPKNAHLHSFDEETLLSFSNDLVENTRYYIFGNKALILLRTYVVLKYLPFSLWKLIDKFVNFLIFKPAHIIVVYERKK